MRKVVMVFLLLVCVVSVKAQNRIIIDGEIGPGSFGFKSPHLSVGTTGEFPIWKFELQPAVSFSPDIKEFAQHGHSISISERGLFWLNRRVAVDGGVRAGRYWSEQPIGSTCPAGWSGPNGPNGQQCLTTYSPLTKGAWNPFVGVLIRDGWYGAPGRLRVEYLFPTGCVWATASNPCTLTSPRERGIEAYQEFQLWPRIRFGIRGGWIRYGDQVNPNAPQLGQPTHDTGFVDATVRFVLFGKSEGY